MEILAPVMSAKEVRALALVGCTEFYFGFVPMTWIQRFSTSKATDKSIIMVSPNKRAGINQSITNEEEVIELCKEVKKWKKKIYVAINSFSIPDMAYKYIDEILEVCDESLVDGYIVTDIGLINYLKEKDLNTRIILSTCQLAINKESVKFFSEIGVNRITFTRHMRMSEIEDMLSVDPKMEFEIFALDGKCLYDESNCRSLHCAGQFCLSNLNLTHYKNGIVMSDRENEIIESAIQDFYQWPRVESEVGKWPAMGCTLCTIFKLQQLGITTLKLSGRGLSMNDRMSVIRLTKKAMEIANSSDSDKISKTKIKEMCGQFFPEGYCENRMGCYVTDDY